jgi:hypothetical protein
MILVVTPFDALTPIQILKFKPLILYAQRMQQAVGNGYAGSRRVSCVQ